MRRGEERRGETQIDEMAVEVESTLREALANRHLSREREVSDPDHSRRP